MEKKKEIVRDTEPSEEFSKLLLEKKRLRKEILEKRNALPDSFREEASRKIREAVKKWKVYREAEVLLAFVSFGSEVDTQILIRDALTEGKRVYCPRVWGEELIFQRISSYEELCPGYRGIMEPPENAEELSETMERGLLLMPGTVFDTDRNRIGYGKGYYDRFLAKLSRQYAGKPGNAHIPVPVTAALAFSVQIVPKVPSETHDFRPEYLFTEGAVYGPEEQMEFGWERKIE